MIQKAREAALQIADYIGVRSEEALSLTTIAQIPELVAIARRKKEFIPLPMPLSRSELKRRFLVTEV
jgi:hypothetical protein